MKTLKLIGVAATLLAAQLATAQPPAGGPPGGMQPPEFKDFDGNADGKIVQEEFSAYMERMMANMPQGQGNGNAGAPGGGPGGGMGMQAMFGRWDTNSDGEVNQAEFDARPRMGPGMGGPGAGQGQGGPR